MTILATLLCLVALTGQAWNPHGYPVPGPEPSPFTGDEDPFCLFWDAELRDSTADVMIYSGPDEVERTRLLYDERGYVIWDPARQGDGVSRREMWAALCGDGEYEPREEYVGP